MAFYKFFIKPFLFGMDPERAHSVVFSSLNLLIKVPGLKPLFRNIFSVNNIHSAKTICGIRFPNSVGLAAGFDKDGKYLDALSLLGFGFIEIGTVTPVAQSGNDQPRLFRLKNDKALINRMGFNNEGVKEMIERLRHKPKGVVVGINIGKNKLTPFENAIDDYKICFTELYIFADYFAINVSSPNTPGLRNLQQKEPLSELLTSLQNLNSDLSLKYKINRRPVFLKIAPDLSNEELDTIITTCIECSIDGIIAVNTTVSRENLKANEMEIRAAGAGGLSGKPLSRRSDEIIRNIKSKAGDRLKIIGVGGISSPEDALQKIKCGADLVQIYTGFIYEGPMLVKNINLALLKAQ